MFSDLKKGFQVHTLDTNTVPKLVRNNNQEMVVDRNAIREQLYSEDLY